MPTVTWSRLGGDRRAAVVAAAEAEFAAHGFSGGSLNAIARHAGVAKGSLFQYFADKRDLYAYITEVGSQRVRSYTEEQIRALDASRPFFEFLTDLLDVWVAYFAEHPRERALHAAASFEVDTDARVSVRAVIHRHYLEVLRPLVHDAQRRGDLSEFDGPQLDFQAVRGCGAGLLIDDGLRLQLLHLGGGMGCNRLDHAGGRRSKPGRQDLSLCLPAAGLVDGSGGRGVVIRSRCLRTSP